MERITEIPVLPPRRPDAHKGNFGRVLIVGGSRGMIGAPALAGLAAGRSGAGLVQLALPGSIVPAALAINPCATAVCLPEDDGGRLSSAALHELLGAVADNDVVAIGPGMSQSLDLRQILASLVAECDKPLLIDADGLNNLAALRPDMPPFSGETILTPHPGEFKRLWEAWMREPMPGDRQEQAAQLAQKTGAVIVLKGAGTIVTDGQRFYVNDTGNPGLATGGTGDVLTGCIAGLLGQGLAPLDAAILGVWAHGKAGDQAAEQASQVGLIASDLPTCLGRILSRNH